MFSISLGRFILQPARQQNIYTRKYLYTPKTVRIGTEKDINTIKVKWKATGEHNHNNKNVDFYVDYTWQEVVLWNAKVGITRLAWLLVVIRQYNDLKKICVLYWLSVVL